MNTYAYILRFNYPNSEVKIQYITACTVCCAMHQVTQDYQTKEDPEYGYIYERWDWILRERQRRFAVYLDDYDKAGLWIAQTNSKHMNTLKDMERRNNNEI